MKKTEDKKINNEVENEDSKKMNESNEDSKKMNESNEDSKKKDYDKNDSKNNENKNEDYDENDLKNDELSSLKNELEKLQIEKLELKLSKVIDDYKVQSFFREFSKNTFDEKEKIANFLLENLPQNNEETEEKNGSSKEYLIF